MWLGVQGGSAASTCQDEHGRHRHPPTQASTKSEVYSSVAAASDVIVVSEQRAMKTLKTQESRRENQGRHSFVAAASVVSGQSDNGRWEGRQGP